MFLQHRPVAPEYSPAQAAALCGCHVDTIRRRLREGSIPGAHRAGDNEWDPWVIPADGLVEAGLLDSVVVPTEIAGHASPGLVDDAARAAFEMAVSQLERTIELLEGQLQFHQQTITRLLGQSGPAANDERSN